MSTTSRGSGRYPLSTLLAGMLAVVGVGLAVTSLLIWANQGFPDLPQSMSRTPVAVIPSQIMAVASITVGALLGHRMPRNPVGWLLLVAGFAMVLILPVALSVAQSHETFRPAPAIVRLGAWGLSSLSAPIVIGCLALVSLFFPDGHLPTRWQRGAAALVVVASVPFAAATAFDPTGILWYPTLANPFAAPPGLESAFDLTRATGALLMMAAAVAVAASIARRYRTGDAVTRAQLRWIVLAVAISVATELPFVLARYVVPTSDAAGEVIVASANLGKAIFPLAAAFAITRYRLFGIDRLINRALVYVPLVGILGGLYALAVALFQRIFVAVTGSPSEVPLLIAVFLIAAAFTPVRKTMEGTVERWARAAEGSAAVGARVSIGLAQLEPSVALGEPLAAARPSAAARREPPGPRGVEDRGEPEDPDESRKAIAALASLRRLEARLASGGGDLDTAAIQPWRIDDDGRVDCPTGSRVPFPLCLGCPYFVSIDLGPPEVRCSRPASASHQG